MATDLPPTPGTTDVRVALPDPARSYAQDAEWFVVDTGDGWREIRFHDYALIYDIPGLYERLFYEILQCQSPPTVCRLLRAELDRAGVDPATLRVLDLGAGNGIMAEELRNAGVGYVVGVDLLPAAEQAARRDRPEVYAAYHVMDMSDLTDAEHEQLAGHRFNALACVAALGFGDIPPGVFREAFNLVADGGWVAFTIKDGFLSDADTSGFSALVKTLVEGGHLDLCASTTYQHRIATTGDPLSYRAVVGRKLSPAP